MSNHPTHLAALERDFAALLDRCDGALARGDDELLALRDLLLDWQFATRQVITAAEERLGAFDGDDSPRALATQAELLIEQIEAHFITVPYNTTGPWDDWAHESATR